MKETFSKYAAKDFLKEQAFLDWVLKDEDAKAWKKWLKENPDQRNRISTALTYLQNTPKTPSPERIRELMAVIYPPQAMAARTPLDYPKQAKPQPFMRLMPYLAAACLVLPLCFFWFTQQDKHSKIIIADRAEQKKHTLPDGSIVKLNAASQLKYNYETWDELRSIELIGEAFFEVKKGSKFTVHTPNGEVSVLGTSFNVNARDESLEVACFTGSVSVKNKRTGESMKIRSQEQIALQGIKLEKSQFDMRAHATWRKGSFYYQKQPVSHILAEIERQYDVYIKAPTNLEKQYLDNFYFDLRESLDDTVDNISRALNVEVEVRGDTILLK